MNNSFLRKLPFGLPLFIGILCLVTVAGAAWLGPSNGTGTAVAGDAITITLDPGNPVEALFPGESGDVGVILGNPNDVDVTITSINSNGPITSNVPTCDSAGHGVSFVNQTGSWLVPANGTLDVVLPDAAVMDISAPTECQQAVFSIPLSGTE